LLLQGFAFARICFCKDLLLQKRPRPNQTGARPLIQDR
jgi:hypothetical protein